MPQSLARNACLALSVLMACCWDVSGQPNSTAATNGAVDAANPPFALPMNWTASGPLVLPVSDASHQIVSIKDPTIVNYDGLWHVYATAYSTSAKT
ncbi:Alpha-L-arabinofuranosidase C precursor [Posidoniimonas polymericola]|uniref:Alpha-L-arabinofuranosidase C n=1 Tax=Posidoniimonas polymericola TaxID=2528002 RepID=A0A5C5YU44_9BACT|nr:hypothetical protein [Posidoniimonas polymericola]TWT78341.1 Alpha-L-arabinofuranosidase C precursor [Posidoniimonas polymericola]